MLHSRGRIIRDASGQPLRMLGVGHDITELKRAEEERIELVREQAARREAEEASRMKDYFLATLSHELRTPLNAIVGWARMLKDHALDEPLRHRAVDAIQRNVSVQAQLVSDILDVARIRSGTLSVDARPVLMRSILGGALDILRPMVESKGIEVVASVPEDAAVIGDEQRLQQVFWNLLSNAAKFAPAGGHIRLHASRDDAADVIEVTVEDDGPGITEDFLPHVFEQFRQADASLTREHGGLGLGLAISHNLVQLHGGTISAANRPEGGALFTVRLPAAVFESMA
jgi:signal transduction histidine kinase